MERTKKEGRGDEKITSLKFGFTQCVNPSVVCHLKKQNRAKKIVEFVSKNKTKMNEYNLQFISDKDLYNHVSKTVQAYSFEMDLKKFNKNLVDPIKLTFDSIVYEQSYEDTIENEVLRQLDKTNSNLIGHFHQNIFEYFSDDWDVPEQGYDIENKKEKIFVEMKNKHNTMNSSSSAKTYMRFQNTLLQDREAKCFLVEIIAKNSQNIPWIVTLDKVKQPANESIRRVSIDKFYEIVTKDEKYLNKASEIFIKLSEEEKQTMEKLKKACA